MTAAIILKSEPMEKNMFDVRKYGAVGNGKTDCTAMIQQAIDACHNEGGGTVLVAGGTYLIYTLNFRSGVRLEIDVNAVLLAGTEGEKYPEITESRYWRPKWAPRNNRRAIIYAEGCENIALTGRGRIDGQGHSFMEVVDEEYPLHRVWQRKHDTLIPGRCLFFVGCRNVLIEDITILNSPGWNTWFLDCEFLQIHRMKTDCDMRLPNVDGIHLSACRDVTVSDCILRCSDDAFILRSHQPPLAVPKPCERVSISNCTLQSGSSAIRLGWTNDFEVRDCIFSNLVIRRSFCGVSVILPRKHLETESAIKPFTVENIRFNNITMETETGLLFIRLDPEVPVGGVRNLFFSNIDAVCGSPPFATFQPEHRVSGISFDNVKIRLRNMKPYNSWLDRFTEYREAFSLDRVENVQFNNFNMGSVKSNMKK